MSFSLPSSVEKVYTSLPSSVMENSQSTGPDIINTLPTEILLEIFNKLHPPSLALAVRTCWRWNAIALPLIYHTISTGSYSQTASDQEILVRQLIDITLKNPNLRSLVRHMTFRISRILLSEEPLNPVFYSSLETLTSYSIDQHSDMRSYARAMAGVWIKGIRKLHIGLRCHLAEAMLPPVFKESKILQGLNFIEELRYTYLRTKSEVAKMTSVRDDTEVIEDCYGGEVQPAETHIYFLPDMPTITTLDLDLGIAPSSFTDVRHSLAHIYALITRYLNSPIPLGTPLPHSKLQRLTHAQFGELATDIADEITRQTTYASPPKLVLDPLPHYHPMRNHARAKLSALRPGRFRDLLTDVRNELLRCYPRLRFAERPYLFPPAEPFRSRIDIFNAMSEDSMVEMVRALQGTGRGGVHERGLRAYMRDAMAYIVPLVYERVTEAGLKSIMTVRGRLFMEGPWIELLVQREGGQVEVVAAFPEMVLESVMEGWGVEAIFRDERRIEVKVGLLTEVDGRWKVVGDDVYT